VDEILGKGKRQWQKSGNNAIAGGNNDIPGPEKSEKIVELQILQDAGIGKECVRNFISKIKKDNKWVLVALKGIVRTKRELADRAGGGKVSVWERQFKIQQKRNSEKGGAYIKM